MNEKKYAEIRKKEIDDYKKLEHNVVSSENEKRNLKSLALLTFILTMNAVPIVCSQLLLAGIESFIYPLLALETMGVSELTTIITNTIENIQNRGKEKEVINYLNKVKNTGIDGIKVGQETTIKKHDKKEELLGKAEKTSNKKLIADVIGKLMLVPEMAGFIVTILTPGTPYLGLVISTIAMIINVICKVKRHEYTKELIDIETELTKIQDNLELGVYYVKYNKQDKKEKTLTNETELDKVLDKEYSNAELEETAVNTSEQEGEVEEYLRRMTEQYDEQVRPFQKIKTSAN